MRTIPPALQANLDRPVQHTARLLQIRARNGMVFGAAMWDRDIEYDHLDGVGPVWYSASVGFDPSTIASAIDYSIANSQARVFAKTDVPDLTVDAVRAGVLDDAQWKCLLVDWRSLVPGSGAVLDAGDVGEVYIEDGMVIIPELLSYLMRLAQPVGHNASVRCRAIFGSPGGTMTGCGVDATGMWETGEVLAVGDDVRRDFVGDTGQYYPGRLEWLTGANVGRRYAIESESSDGFVLADPMPFPIEVGDTYRHRPDCTKLKDGPMGCDSYSNYINFKGEDRIPIGDGVSGSVPGAQAPGKPTGEMPSDNDPIWWGGSDPNTWGG